jgi:hypothetical protein
MAITWSGTAWVALTAYAVRARVVNGGNVYVCITAGTSAAATGPTGTDSDITDGTVHWQYLGVYTGCVLDVAPELSAIAAGSQGVFLALADNLVSDIDVWGDLLDDGRRYLAAHFGELSKFRGHGPITAQTVGPLSRSYASLTGAFAVDLTSAGRMYMDLVRTTSAVLGLVV